MEKFKISFKKIFNNIISNNSEAFDEQLIENYSEASSSSKESEIEEENSRGKRIKFKDYSKHLWVNGTSVTYFVPEIGKCSIVFSQEEIKSVEQALTWGDVFPDNYDRISQQWIDKAKWKEPNSENPKFTLFYHSYKNEPLLNNALSNQRKRDTKAFNKACEKSIEKLHKKFCTFEKGWAKNNQRHVYEKQSFRGFKWNSFDKNKTMLKSFYCDKIKPVLVQPLDLNEFTNGRLSLKSQMLAEWLFGSAPKILESVIADPVDFTKVYKNVRKRHSSIIYLLKNPRLSKTCSKAAWEKMINPLSYEMNHSLLNSKNESVVGFQYQVKLIKEVVDQFPFDAALIMNSSIGRLYVVENYDRLISHPEFIKSKMCRNTFGFTIETDQDAKSKLFIVLLTYI